MNDERLKYEQKRASQNESRDFTRDLLTYEQYADIKSFINNGQIIDRKTDKINTFVKMSKSDYLTKLEILPQTYRNSPS